MLPVSAVYAAIPSFDLAASEAFYETWIGHPVDERPKPVLAQWRWGNVVLQLVDDAERAGGGLTVAADEVTVVAQVAVLTDPDGNQIALVESR